MDVKPSPGFLTGIQRAERGGFPEACGPANPRKTAKETNLIGFVPRGNKLELSKRREGQLRQYLYKIGLENFLNKKLMWESLAHCG